QIGVSLVVSLLRRSNELGSRPLDLRADVEGVRQPIPDPRACPVVVSIELPYPTQSRRVARVPETVTVAGSEERPPARKAHLDSAAAVRERLSDEPLVLGVQAAHGLPIIARQVGGYPVEESQPGRCVASSEGPLVHVVRV